MQGLHVSRPQAPAAAAASPATSAPGLTEDALLENQIRALKKKARPHSFQRGPLPCSHLVPCQHVNVEVAGSPSG